MVPFIYFFTCFTVYVLKGHYDSVTFFVIQFLSAFRKFACMNFFKVIILSYFCIYSPRKYLHGSKDETFQQGIHELTGMQQLADQVIRYDLDDIDVCWLNLINDKREETSEILIDEWVMEQVIEAFEAQVSKTY